MTLQVISILVGVPGSVWATMQIVEHLRNRK